MSVSEGKFVSGSVVLIFVGVVIVGAIFMGLYILSALRSVRKLERCCAAELEQLKTLLSSRHLILSHLTDSVPSRLDSQWDRRRLQERLRRAEKGLLSLDPAVPDVADFRSLEDNEQSLMEGVEDLKEVLENADVINPVQAIAGCLDGLEKKSREILDAVSTYNAAAITLSGLLNSSPVAPRNARRRFEILDLEPPGSSISGSGGMPPNRVAT